jgi:predicted SnoaL-like aldol condensation-catalyzing enzyme
MTTNRKNLICGLLKGVAAGDPESVAVVNESSYIQHDPQTPDGIDGMTAMRDRLADIGPGLNIVRVFEDGDFVFVHAEYDSEKPSIGFEVFRFDGAQVVEHWHNIQPRQGPNPSGHSMVDGQTKLLELEKTESNREIVQAFIEDVLIQRKGEKIYDYIKWNHFVEHNPRGSDDLDALIAMVSPSSEGDADSISYEKCHRILAEGNFVLSICEGRVKETPAAFYDLWCLEHDYIVEHWDTTELIPPPEQWKNRNGKF